MKRSIGRRAFLGSLGATTAAATFLRPILAQSQTGAAPQRLLMIHRPCGSVLDPARQPGAPSYWWPTSGASGGKDWIVAPGGLIDSFKKSYIYSIFCLQEPGEHPYCGDGIHASSGLSYLPEEFYERIQI